MCFLVHSSNVRNKILYTAKDETYNKQTTFWGRSSISSNSKSRRSSINSSTENEWRCFMLIPCFVRVLFVYVRSVNQLHVRLNVTLQLYWHWCRINNSLEGITKYYTKCVCCVFCFVNANIACIGMFGFNTTTTATTCVCMSEYESGFLRYLRFI